jgi:hypothetical protein
MWPIVSWLYTYCSQHPVQAATNAYAASKVVKSAALRIHYCRHQIADEFGDWVTVLQKIRLHLRRLRQEPDRRLVNTRR